MVYLFLCRWTFSLFPPFSCSKATKTCVDIFVNIFISPGRTRSGESLDPTASLCLTSQGNCQTVFQSSAVSHSQRWCRKAPISPHRHQHLLPSLSLLVNVSKKPPNPGHLGGSGSEASNSISAQVTISRSVGLSPSSGSALTAWSLLENLSRSQSPSLSASLSLPCSCILSLKLNKHEKKKKGNPRIKRKNRRNWKLSVCV